MTCIVALRDGKRVLVGADSAASGGTSSIARADTKIFRNGKYVIGCTHDYRTLQILKHESLSQPNVKVKPDQHIYNLTHEIRKLFKQHEAVPITDSRPGGGHWLIAWDAHLYEIYSDYQYARYREPYAACGCGEDFALGSLYSTAGQSKTPQERVKLALKAATHFSGAVKPPFKILATENEQTKTTTQAHTG